jgi:hypothetical protein
VTVTSRLHRQKDKERQRKTEENVDRRPEERRVGFTKVLE